MGRHMSVAAKTAALVTVLLAAHAMATAQVPDRPRYLVPESETTPVIDGVLDDTIWAGALSIDLAYETNPGESTPADPEYRTTLYLASNSTHLYAAFVCRDPDPSQICASMTERDRMYDGDRVTLILDTSNDQRSGYMLFCNPYGVQGDALDKSGCGAGDTTWDAIWESEGRIDERGYTVEMAVPFSSLRFQRSEGPQTWGVGAGRRYPRSLDYRVSLTERDRDNACYLCQVALVTGFDNASPGRNLELDPTVSGFVTQARDGFPDGDFEEQDSDVEPGLTARWGVTPNIVMSAAANPDFSQVEADAFQLDVNRRFALHYEEKRPFFYEGMELFETYLNVLYTRTIADPRWGLKLTGKEGSSGFGAFVAEDEFTNVLLPSSQGSFARGLDDRSMDSALRYTRDFGANSMLGAFVTNREAGDYHNRVAGVDGRLNFLKTEWFTFQALGSRTQYPDEFAVDNGQPDGEFDGYALDARYERDSGDYDWWVSYREIDADFRADMGFRTRTDYREGHLGLSRNWRGSEDSWYSSVDVGAGCVYIEEMDRDLLSKFYDYWIYYDGPSRTCVNVYGTLGREGYLGREYDDSYLDVQVGLWPTGDVYVGLDTILDQTVDYDHARPADRIALEPSVSASIGERLNLTLVHDYETLDVDEGRLYTANVTYMKGTYLFSRRAALRAILQYIDCEFNTELYAYDIDSESQRLSSQVLFSYKVNPQTVVYLGYSDNHYGGGEVDLTQNDRTFFAKVGYAFVL